MIGAVWKELHRTGGTGDYPKIERITHAGAILGFVTRYENHASAIILEDGELRCINIDDLMEVEVQP